MNTKIMHESEKFTFWKAQSNETFELPLKEIKEKYSAWLKTKNKNWLKIHGHETVIKFIADPKGLNGLGDLSENKVLKYALCEIRKEFIS